MLPRRVVRWASSIDCVINGRGLVPAIENGWGSGTSCPAEALHQIVARTNERMTNRAIEKTALGTKTEVARIVLVPL